MNFKNIEYLQFGNDRQRRAYSILTQNQILLKLKSFDPILVGTIPLNIDIKGSDLDIICNFSERGVFEESIINNFGSERSFVIKKLENLDSSAIVAHFIIEGIKIEIFGQTIPTKEQLGYRHMIVENKLLTKYGEKFRQQIIKLKRLGYKTEPAFAKALGLEGDPYQELLKFESDKKS